MWTTPLSMFGCLRVLYKIIENKDYQQVHPRVKLLRRSERHWTHHASPFVHSG
jgi:hypothetical protein